MYSMRGTMLTRRETASSWVITANTVHGTGTRTVSLSAENLANFTVNNSSGGGAVRLVLSQGGNELSLDLSGRYNQMIDMEGFLPGRVRMRVSFDGARDVRFELRW
jgi:hypothetical protein